MNDFSAGACIRFGWETFKKRPWFLIGSFLLYMVVVGTLDAACDQLIQQGGAVDIVATVARLVIDLVAGMSLISFALKAHDSVETVRLGDFWKLNPFWKYTGTIVLYWIIVLCGIVLLIVPGFIWSVMFGFAILLVMDRNMMPMDALKESKRMTYGYKWQLFWLGILSALVVVLGLICLVVGILVAYPVAMLAFVHAYRILQQKNGTPTAM